MRDSSILRRILKHLCLRTESSRLVLAFVFLVSCGVFTAWIQQLSDTRWVSTRPELDPPLEDLFNYLPNLVPHQRVVDIMLVVLLGMTVLSLLIIPPDWTMRIIALRRLCWVAGFLYLYRSLTLSVTTLPTTLPDCKPLVTTGKSAGEVFWTAVQQVVGVTHSCTDLIYSGHTMVFTTCAIQFRIYSPYKILTYYAYVHAAVGVIMIILTHMHYTVDVVLGLFITYAFWSVYMGLVRMTMERLKWALTHEEALGVSPWEKDDEEYQRVAYTPRMINSGLVRAVLWLDGIDLRWARVLRMRGESGHALVPKDGSGIEMVGEITTTNPDMNLVV